MKSVQKNIVYRSATITNCESTLQQLIESSLQKTKVSERLQQLNEYEKTFRTINRSWSYRGIVVCEMVLIDPGASQPVAVYDDSKEFYTIDAVSTKELNKERLKENSDFVNSMLYFGVKGNEVVVMPSQAINVRALETYLSWFLGDRLKLISNDSNFILNKNIPKKIEDKIKSSPVKSIAIGTFLSTIDGKNSNNENSEEFISEQEIHFSTKHLLQALGNTFHFEDKLPFSISDESNIRAKIVISYYRKTNEAGQKFLNHIGTTLRNLDDADVCVKLKNNTEISGEELSLHKIVKIGKTDRGLLISNDISEAMVSWLIELNEERETS